MSLEKKPAAWLVLTAGYVMVAGLGFIDYMIGDYSILIFYVVPVLVVAWNLGRRGAVHISLASGLARTFSDYYTYSASTFRLWNSMLDMMFLLMVGLLMVFIKTVVNHDSE